MALPCTRSNNAQIKDNTVEFGVLRRLCCAIGAGGLVWGFRHRALRTAAQGHMFTSSWHAPQVAFFRQCYIYLVAGCLPALRARPPQIPPHAEGCPASPLALADARQHGSLPAVHRLLLHRRAKLLTMAGGLQAAAGVLPAWHRCGLRRVMPCPPCPRLPCSPHPSPLHPHPNPPRIAAKCRPWPGSCHARDRGGEAPGGTRAQRHGGDRRPRALLPRADPRHALPVPQGHPRLRWGGGGGGCESLQLAALCCPRAATPSAA